jgi:hypothetical protein
MQQARKVLQQQAASQNKAKVGAPTFKLTKCLICRFSPALLQQIQYNDMVLPVPHHPTLTTRRMDFTLP